MLKIRLQRVGKRHEPKFRLVLTDSQNSTKSGRFNEILGSYDPRRNEDALKVERIKYWISQGALPTATVNNLLIKHGVIAGKKINVSAKSKKKTATEGEAPQDVVEPSEVSEEKPVEDTPPVSSEVTAVKEETPKDGTIKEVADIESKTA